SRGDRCAVWPGRETFPVLLPTRSGFEMTYGGADEKFGMVVSEGRQDGGKQKAARLCTGRPWFRGFLYSTTFDREGSRTRRVDRQLRPNEPLTCRGRKR